MKLLVTGGAGFIGSAVIRYVINNTTDEVVNLDKLTYAGNLESLAEVGGNHRYSFEKVDICNRAEVDRVLAQSQPDAIMHLAAESHVDRSIEGPADFIGTNIVGTYTLLEATRQYWQAMNAEKKGQFRLHHISTDEVYGDLPHPADYPFPLAEERPRERGRLCLSSQKRQPTRPAVLTQPAKQAQITSSVPGSAPTACQHW